MKKLTKNLLKMQFKGLDFSNVEKIEFAFSQHIGVSPLKLAEYPSDAVTLIRDDIVGVAWSKAETALFKAGQDFYADTRITLSDSEFQPETHIVRLKMEPTLFEEAE